MNSNMTLLEELYKAIKNNPDVSLGKFIRYISSVSNLAYMTDEDIARQMKHYNRMAEKNDEYNYVFEPCDIHYMLDASFYKGFPEEKLYDFTKENEQIAYDRYKEKTKGRVFFNFEERLDCCDFLKRFTLEFVEAEDFKGITVINHCDNFLDVFPMAYRHMNAYAVARVGDKYIAKHKYVVKNPCFGELLEQTAFPYDEEFDECFSIVIDWCESPRFTDYTEHIMYGMRVWSAGDKIEIFNPHQTIEIFHELMQKSNKVISEWRGDIYDDGTVEG